MKQLEYPYDADYILRKKKAIRRELLAREGIQYIDKKIAILGGSTTSDIKLILELFLLNYGIRPEFYESEYNKYFEDAVFGNPELDDFKPDLVFVHTTTRNIARFPAVTDTPEQIDALIDETMGRFGQIWQALSERFKCTVIQNNFEQPYFRLLGNSDFTNIHGRLNFINRLNDRFCAYAQTHQNFFINDINYVSAVYGIKKWADPGDWYRYKYALSVSAIPDFAFNLAHIIKAVYGRNKKAFALDMDNTLWGGIVGDDGPENIKIGHEDAESELFTEFQQYIKAHKDLGILLTVASKNDEENALAGLARPDSTLKQDDFIIIKANWENKDRNIANIAQELNIGSDSFVFVDDNPVERTLVEEQIAGISVPAVGAPETYIDTIDSNGFFEVTGISEEDIKRGGMYKANMERAKASASFDNYDDYLKSLDMKAEIKPFAPVYMARIAELTNKSNQFNLTTKRCSQAEIENFASDPSYITLYGRLEDKFGDNGVVAVTFGHAEGDTFYIDLWLMSCRVLKRGMEFAMMDELIAEAKSRNITKIKGYYYPTAKNKIVRDFYELQGFTKISEAEDGATEWILDLNEPHKSGNVAIKVN